MPESSKPKKGKSSAKNSSKTSRVLGLLTTSTPTEEVPAPVEGGAAPTAAAAAERPPAVPKPSDDQVVEAKIRNALEELLEELPPVPSEPKPEPEPLLGAEPEPESELALQPEAEAIPDATRESKPIPTPERELEPEAEPEPETAPELEMELETEAIPDFKPAPEPIPAPERKPESKPEPRVPEEPESRPSAPEQAANTFDGAHPTKEIGEEIVCYNVMQALVQAKTEKYMNLFHLCTCPRCRTDVIALALTKLPPKYIAAKGNELVPLLSIYEGRFNTAVVSQVINACNIVMQNPRHEKPS